MRRKGERAEYIGKHRIANVQSAGERAEGRHDHARGIGCETAPAHRAAAMRDTRDRMQMAADFARRTAWKMAEC